MDCARHPKAFERGMALLNYEEASRRSMAAIKYKNKREYLDFYADCMVSEYGERIRRIAPDALVPVPIHKKRMRERGFNQAEVLAEKMSVKLEIPVCADRLIRRKNTDPQKELSAAERLENLKDAFAVLGSLSHLEKVLLIDDIYTTGATAQACTLALKKAGVRQVFLLTICIGSGEKH